MVTKLKHRLRCPALSYLLTYAIFNYMTITDMTKLLCDIVD